MVHCVLKAEITQQTGGYLTFVSQYDFVLFGLDSPYTEHIASLD